jgi:hypothetical protein
MKHKNKKTLVQLKKSKTYDSIYKALPFVHIGMIYFGCFYQNISFTLLLLQLLLLGNDVAENPGPETKVGEVNVFHWNSRSIRPLPIIKQKNQIKIIAIG